MSEFPLGVCSQSRHSSNKQTQALPILYYITKPQPLSTVWQVYYVLSVVDRELEITVALSWLTALLQSLG